MLSISLTQRYFISISSPVWHTTRTQFQKLLLKPKGFFSMLLTLNFIIYLHVLFGKIYFIVSSVNHMNLYLSYTVSKYKDIVFFPLLTVIHTVVINMYSHRFQCYTFFILYINKFVYTNFVFLQHFSLCI